MDLKPRALVALAVLAALTVLSLWSVAPPSPRPASAAAGAFSAERAFAHVERVGSEVHVAGSPAAAGVRGYLQSTLTGLGVATEVQDAVGATDALGGMLGMARARNVVGTLAGSNPTGTVFLVAHYDSVQVSYGANDDGAGVATLLEVARALAQEPMRRNDIVFLFTDAEEACLCGAEAFVHGHPRAAQGGVVLNFEARGAGGPVIMFETSRGNAGVVGVYADAVPYPVATSFAVEVYRILPNDTDFTPFLDADRFTGLNSAYIDGSAVYHSPEDRPSYLDKGALQQHGDNALAMTRAFAGADLADLSRPSGHDSTYFPVLRQLVRYPGWLVWPLAVLAALAVGALAYLARRRGETTWRRAAAGFGLALVPLVLAPVAAQLLWLLLTAIRPGYGEMLDPWRPGWFRLGVVAFVAAVVLGWYGLLRRRLGGLSLAIGGLGWLAVLGLVLAAATPGGSYLAALPALFGALAAIGGLWLKPLPRLAVLTLGGAVAVLILAPTVLLFFPALGLATGGVAALFAAMLGLALLPVLDGLYGTGRWFLAAPALVSTVAAVALVATGLSVDRFDEAHPEPTQLMYALDTDTGKALWVSAEGSPSDWTGQYVDGREDLSGPFPPLGEEELATGPAEAAALPPPVLTLVSESTSGGERTLNLRLAPARPVRLVYLGAPAGTRVVRATVQGREVPGSDHFGVLFHAPPGGGVTITLVLAATGPVALRAMDGSDGLSGLPGFRPRPPGIGVEGSHDSELVLVARTYTI